MLRRVRELFEKKAAVLMYHRIAQPDMDPWQLSVSAANFEEQLDVLHTSYNVIPVQDLVAQLDNRSLTPGSICITFDDGYRDNYLFAKPLLQKYACPAGFFLATHFINRRQQFWWDELEDILLRQSALPAVLTLHINHSQQEFRLDHGGVLHPDQWQKHTTWVWFDPPPTQRCAVYLELWKQIRPLPFKEIEAVMRQIRTWAASEPRFQEHDLPMTTQQITDLLHHPLFTVGIHTVTHVDLSAHSHDIQLKEIAGCAEYLYTNFDSSVHAITYPYGKYNNDTLSIIKELQVAAAFTTHETFVTKRSDPHQLGRFQVKNWNGKDFKLHLHSWGLKGK